MKTKQPRSRVALAIFSTVLAASVVLSGFAGTDDLWPLAPFRMFSYGNNPNGVVRNEQIKATTADGKTRTYGAGYFGLRRAEIEEQTLPDKRVPDQKLKDFVDAFHARYELEPNDPGRIVHFQIVVRSQQMADGKPSGEPTEKVIGDWANERYTGKRVEVDLPLAEPWAGYGS